MRDFANQVILITGAGQGLGREAALAFATRGASLALNDLLPIHLDDTLAQVRALGAPAKAYPEDIARRMPVQWLIEQVRADWGRVDVLINCASVRPSDPILTMDEWDWHRTLDVNLTGPFLLIQAVAPLMQAQGGGVMINVGPVVQGRLADIEPAPAYSASKTGLLSLTREAGAELAAIGIRVHSVYSDTRPLPLSPSETPQAGRAPREFGSLLVYLCGPDGKEITGGCFAFDLQNISTGG